MARGRGRTRFRFLGEAEATPAIEFPDLPYIFYRASADNPANTSVTIDEAFDPADVDTTNHKLLLPDLGFAAFTSYAAAKGNALRFSTTGTLPPELDPDEDYYISPAAGGGYDVYPVATSAHAATTPGAFAYENAYPAQNFAQRVNKIQFTGQGTGVHTLYSPGDLVSVLPNLVADKLYTTEPSNAADLHQHMERLTDENGHQYIRSRRLFRDNGEDNTYNVYGKTYQQKGAANGAAARAEIANKRCIMHTYVVTSELTRETTHLKCSLAPTAFNTSTNVITHYTVNILTGTVVRFRPVGGGVLPSPLSDATDYYARRISGTTITLHPTASDATNNTNIVDITDQGSGVIQLYADSIPGDTIERMRFVCEQFNPNSDSLNILTPAFNQTPGTDATFIISTDFVVSGSTNGELGFSGRSIYSAAVKQVTVDFPPGAVPPVRSDTGLPLASGTYWISPKHTGTVFVRLHDTEASALAAVGVATASTSCIKFNGAVGSGNVRVRSLIRPFSAQISSGAIAVPPTGWSMPQNELGVLTWLVDYNDPAATYVRNKIFWNGELVDDFESTGVTKGSTAASSGATTTAWFLLNSAAAHVTWEGRLYGLVFGATTGAIADADIESIYAYYKSAFPAIEAA